MLSLQLLIDEATILVEEQGYRNADPNSVQLAVSGFMIREFRGAIKEGFVNLKDPKKRGVPKVVEQAKIPAIFAGVVAVVETIRAFFS